MNHFKDMAFLLVLVALSACLVLVTKNQTPVVAAKTKFCEKCSRPGRPFDPIKQASPINIISTGIFHLPS
jgi:hypothetical protein